MMRITLRQLQIFKAVASAGTTMAAARALPLSQSATSTAVKELERALGVPLFDRVGKSLLLNDSGRTLLPMALAILDSTRVAESALQSNDLEFADVRLFASTTIGNYILPALLARFRTLAPITRLEVRIGNTAEAVAAVREFSADLGLIEGPCRVSDVSITPWLEDELLVVAAPTHPLAKSARHRRLTLEQLRGAPWLLRESGSGTREAVELALLPHLHHIQPAMTLGSSEAIKNAVSEGLGISCLSRAVVRELVATRRLTVIRSCLPPLSRRLALIHHRKKVLSLGLQKFVQFSSAFSNRLFEQAP